eukprot:scaffold55767_cov36-Tisochrysis_lutea.AAC.2
MVLALSVLQQCKACVNHHVSDLLAQQKDQEGQRRTLSVSSTLLVRDFLIPSIQLLIPGPLYARLAAIAYTSGMENCACVHSNEISPLPSACCRKLGMAALDTDQKQAGCGTLSTAALGIHQKCSTPSTCSG